MVVICLLAPAVAACAGSLRTRNGQVLEGDLHFEPPGWVLVVPKVAGEFPLAFKLADVVAINLRPPLGGVRTGGTLPGDWSVRDIGSGADGGTSHYSQGEFTLRGAGTPLASALDSFHYLYHPLPSNGELVTRVQSVSGRDSNQADLDPLAPAGVMIRQGLEAGERFCAVAVTSDDGPKFYFRRNVEGQVAVTPVVSRVKIKAPYWLKIARYGDQIVASISHDGKAWERVANPRMDGMRDAYVGLFVDSNRTDQLATGVFDHVRATIHGLRAEYYGDTQFKDLRLARVDGQINFQWFGQSPAPEMSPEGFSVRWTGQLSAPSTDAYHFIMAADTAARLYVNDKMVLDTKSKVHHDGTVNMVVDKRYDVRVDYYAGSTPATCCKLFWSTPVQPEAQPVPSEYFFYTPPARAGEPPEPDAVRAKPYANAKGVLLTDGSFIPGSAVTADDKSVTFTYRDRKSVVIATSQVARVVFHPLPESADAKIAGKGAGAYTLGGDFVEGDCLEIKGGLVKLNSVVFGVSTFDTATHTAALVYHETGRSDAAWTLRTIGGGVIHATAYRVEGERVTVEEPSIGSLELKLHELVEISANR